ncbi:glycoside hydrolase family 3 C-terminal domain-containing protein [Chlorogloeopsis sp. ULAP01]|uniref:beta-glucosidase family protein n=1 Tax=Chlorogloeopsis sp. ULAP01 TaxID=3056483 RepID=UPI0025AC554C|nr:glycoside hydrolase family 3 C-terminal domain-containing protein [Chlorogloeopsis sp. ULAP01]
MPRLGVPPQKITDGPIGVTNPLGSRVGDTATALPCGLCLGSTFNPTLAREAGAVIGREARLRGYNVICGGGINLPRDPRHGRNFEYISEDPWLSGVMGAENVIGTQSEGVISMLKHVSLNVNEINKFWLDAIIDPIAHRESDLLAFQIGIERGNPGSLMGAYNKVNGAYNCGNDPILNGVIKDAIGFKGYIMSDWMAVYHWDFALKGLDQHSGAQLDQKEWFNEPLKEAMANGEFPRARLSDMVRRILRSIHMVGVDQWDGESGYTVDMAKHNDAALEVARQGIVLLKNDDAILPLSPDLKTIAVIGWQVNKGVVAGGGSSQTLPTGGYAAEIPIGGDSLLAPVRTEAYHPCAPLAEIKKQLPHTKVMFDPGIYPADAAEQARRADIAIVFGVKFESEGFDDPDLTLPYGQDAMIEAVATANPNTIVVLETGNPIAMPWRDKVKAIIELWFPGQAGGTAIAEVLTGRINPSGRLPITFPADVQQLPRPELPNFGEPFGKPSTVHFNEGAEIGYRWFAKTNAKPLYGFGYGLSYTRFAYSNFTIEGGETIKASLTVKNVGDRAGADVPQLYLTEAAGDKRMRLLGFERVQLEPGESKRVEMMADPRLLARFDGDRGQWRIDEGTYTISLSRAADDLVETAETTLIGQHFGR